MKRILLATALLAAPLPAMADDTSTCVWVQAENGNFLTLSNPDCVTWQTGKGDMTLTLDDL